MDQLNEDILQISALNASVRYCGFLRELSPFSEAFFFTKLYMMFLTQQSECKIIFKIIKIPFHDILSVE